MDYEPVIGLEVHAQIHTRSKMFCSCRVVEDTGDLEPNTYVCPVCTAMPGVLPVINRRAVEVAITTGLALGCRVPEFSRFARKSYFYPDLPKGYQISQYNPVFPPLSVDGCLDIETEAGVKRVGVNRAHLEEDTGKLRHVGAGSSLVDLNRAGVPLLEIVSEPDLRSAEEVLAYATKLHAILVYLGVNSGDMEKGVMRFEANVSVRPAGTDEMNPRHEIKNLNSFRALSRSVAYEIEEQIATLEAGGAVVQQTMGWDEARGVTVAQRGKEFADDYRYFPEPDLPLLQIDRGWVEELRAGLPELPDAKRARFVADYGLGDHDAGLLVADRAVADYYEAVVAAGVDPQTGANWVTGELFRLMNEAGAGIGAVQVTPEALAGLIGLVRENTINTGTAKEVLEEMFAGGEGAGEIVERRGLAQISDAAALAEIVRRVLDDNPEQVAGWLGGKVQVAGWLVGQVMKATRGKANPQMVRGLLEEQLEARRTDH